MSNHTPRFLWAAFLMMVESDGKNEAQLLEWAGLKTFADRFVRERLWEGRDNYNGWPAESVTNSLALWLMWLTTDEGAFSRHEVPDCRVLTVSFRIHALFVYRWVTTPMSGFIRNSFPLSISLRYAARRNT